MKKQKTIYDGKTVAEEFRAQRATYLVPRVLKEYYDEDGIRMYKCEGRRHYVADTYDRLFVPPKMDILPKHTKDKFGQC